MVPARQNNKAALINFNSTLLKWLAVFCVLDSVDASLRVLSEVSPSPSPSPSPTCGCSAELEAVPGELSNFVSGLDDKLEAELGAIREFVGMTPPSSPPAPPSPPLPPPPPPHPPPTPPPPYAPLAFDCELEVEITAAAFGNETLLAFEEAMQATALLLPCFYYLLLTYY